MQKNLSSVKIERQYHHGDLRRGLLDSALTVLAEKGVDGFSLRETTRRAGVSPAAHKHHFADTRALMTALATIAFSRLADALENADAGAGPQRAQRLKAQGAAYVNFALDERALFDLMWRTGLLDMRDSQLLLQKDRAFDCLDRLVRGNAAPRIAHDDTAMAATLACWSLVHGFASLVLDGGLAVKEARAGLVDNTLPAMLGLLTLPK